MGQNMSKQTRVDWVYHSTIMGKNAIIKTVVLNELNRMMFRSLSILSRCCITIHQKIPLGHLGTEPQPPWGGSWRVAPNSRCRSWHFRRGPPASCGHGLRMLTKNVGMWHGKYRHYKCFDTKNQFDEYRHQIRIVAVRRDDPKGWVPSLQLLVCWLLILSSNRQV